MGEKRYVIEALIGPCDYKEAEEFLDEATEGLPRMFRLGACWSLREYDESVIPPPNPTKEA